jgi:peptidoglycan/xylan/chitin deacetylase (PgdA/CDA1 family)
MIPHSQLQLENLSIFLLHGVVESSDYQVRNYNRKHLELSVFKNYMEGLKRVGTPLSMDQVVEILSHNKSFPSNSFAITFDDGFENNYSVALPVLEKLELPATFYITTGFIQENQMSWIDKIEYCFENKEKIDIKLPWRTEIVSIDDKDSKIEILSEIRLKVKNSTEIHADNFSDDICLQCGFPQLKSSTDPLDLKLSWNQIESMHKHPLFTIGGHSHTHAILSYLSPDALEAEVALSLSLLESEANVITTHYSYPEGLLHCYSDEVIRSLKNHGIVCSPSAEFGWNNHSTDLFHLKRINLI